MALTTKQHEFIKTFAVGVFAGLISNIIAHTLTKKQPPHPIKPVTEETPKTSGWCPPPGA